MPSRSPDRRAGAAARPRPELPMVECASEAEWEQWLEDHAASSGVWLKFAKRGGGATTVSHAEALDVAICFGWIDGQVRRMDETYYLQRFTPRGPRSKWSQVNRETAERLIAAGRMRASGHAHIASAQLDGRWEAAYEPPSRATVPDDFREALDAEPGAKAFFETLTVMRRYAFLYRLHHVKTPEARRRRIAGYIELLRKGRALD
ncbi:MAG TPA: YdeI/OmpD-associated family protein [Solirubrobacteraceae bacterium]|nr:YdeI/OmpD-associated family protein [Solirubrobacteraceae bacterium]